MGELVATQQRNNIVTQLNVSKFSGKGLHGRKGDDIRRATDKNGGYTGRKEIP